MGKKLQKKKVHPTIYIVVVHFKDHIRSYIMGKKTSKEKKFILPFHI